MTRSSLIQALAPAVVAAVAGVISHVIWGAPAVSLLAAVAGAAAGGLYRMREMSGEMHATTEVRAPRTPPEIGFAEIVGGLPIGVLVIGRNAEIRLANPMARALFGLPNQPDLPVATLRARRLLDRISAALEQGEDGHLDITLTRGAERHLLAHVRAVGDGTARVVVIALQDETAARKSRELHRDFVANASHELKTPLAVISGIIETLAGPARGDAEGSERFLSLMSEQTRRMTRLVEDLLSLNRIELNERAAPNTRLDVSPVLDEIVEALRPAAVAAGVALTIDVPSPAPEVLADRDEIGQLARNLIDNAIRYGGTGTSVTISAAKSTEPGMLVVSVCDTGPGISREDLPRLTERFYRVDAGRSREKGGTGLGLAIVKHIVNRHRGRLEIESEIGEGSVFRVFLPLADRPGEIAGEIRIDR